MNAGPVSSPPALVLIVKMTSLGDVVHTLPAVDDAARRCPGIAFDWVVEDSFADIPRWHPAVRRAIPVAGRRWRRRPRELPGGGAAFLRALRSERYDRVIDAQGLMKSALVALLARGRRCGFALADAREGAAALTYSERYPVPRGMHAVERIRRLFAAVLGYPAPAGPPEYGIDPERVGTAAGTGDAVLFLPGTTWPSKRWPLTYWRDLALRCAASGLQVQIAAGSDRERADAQSIARGVAAASVLPPMTLSGLAAVIAGARAAVAVDSGLSHVAAALGTPCITLYGASSADLTGTLGPHQVRLRAEFPCSPCLRRTCSFRGERSVEPACFATAPPQRVWAQLAGMLPATAPVSAATALE